jgi:hypothetical protein
MDPAANTAWLPVAKVGLGFILAGLLIMLLKELLIAIIAAGTIGIGLFILSVAWRVWRAGRRPF